MSEPLTITIPMTPPRDCNPNARVHWRRRHAASARAELAAYLATKNAINERRGGPCGHPGPLYLTWLVGWEKGHKAMDQTNLVASYKPFEDGIARALGVNDKVFVSDEPVQVRDKLGAGFTIVTVTEGQS